ncbi:MAG: hypothetical protein P8J42_03400 [Pseudomonadales bacterium]|nr:hypothetical protein [Pseudomonadales bacterium]
MIDKATTGRINQSLYFARLHCDSARALVAGSDSKPQFLRQQQLCFFEASADCSFRAVYFLAIDLLDQGQLRSELIQTPKLLLNSLKLAYQDKPTAEINNLIQALEDPHLLAALLSVRHTIWSHNVVQAAPAKDMISLVDVSLSLESCERWQQLITEMVLKVQGSSAEC